MHTPTHAHTHTRSYTLGKTCSNTIRQLDAFTETEIHNTEKRVRLVPFPDLTESSKLNYKLITSYVNGNVECNFCCCRHRFLFLLLFLSAAYASSSRIAGCRCAVAVVDNLKLPSNGTELPGGRRSGVFASMLTDFCTISGPLAWR